MTFSMTEHQHMRFNPLKDDWILVSPHRMLRPWTGQTEQSSNESVKAHDPQNPLCPGAVRSNGQINPNYESTFVFTNDFPALLEEIPEPITDKNEEHELLQVKAAKGTCRVMCFHPRSDMSIPKMTVPEITNVIDKWVEETAELGEKYAWVQIFENKGATMGCSNPHPHSQIWASSFLPNEPRIKNETQRKYWVKHGRPMLQDYVALELEKKVRIVCSNADWLVLVPYWAVWPFETMILPIPKASSSKPLPQRITDLTQEEKTSLAEIMKSITNKYDNLFNTSFPYSMGWHGAPTGEFYKECNKHWVFHGMYFPPLLRSATVKKFMVGYEMLAQAQRDLTAETAAALLRNLPDY